MSEQEKDLEIVQKVQKGDKNAYQLLVVKYQKRISYLVSKYVKNSGDVADVTQEIFIRAYRGLHNFRGDSAFYTWLYRIGINTSKNYLMERTRKQADSAVDVDDAEFYEGNEGLKNNATPERNLMRDQLEKVLFEALESLPEDLRIAISLRELDGMSYEDISSIMECPIGTVRSRIFRAREALDKAIAPLM